MLVPPAAAHGFDIARVQNCLFEFSVKVRYNSHSLRIYMFRNNVDLKNNNINFRKPF